MATLAELETVAQQLIDLYDVQAPPIPVESMLQKPKLDMWQEMDITQISGGFLRVDDTYSPRMSMARLLARHVVFSDWGKSHGIADIAKNTEQIHAFARMLVMPRSLVDELSAGAKSPPTMRLHFEVPEEEAQQRLKELTRY